MKNIRIILAIIFLSILGSCSDFLEQEDLDELTSDSVFRTEVDMTFALTNLYTYLPEADILGEVVPYFWTDDALHRNINARGNFLCSR